MMRITVIVPVRNEALHIEKTLQCLIDQNFPQNDYEILVIDGLSEDDTVPRIRRMQERASHISLYYNPRRLSSAARNIGVRQARGQYIVIVDGHCAIPDRNYLQHIMEAFETSGADTLGRPQPLQTSRPTAFQRSVSLARHSWLGHNPDSDVFSDVTKFVDPQNVAVAYRREVFERIGLFDERFDACEDVELNTRASQAGLTCWFTPKIAVEYTPRASFAALFRQMKRYGQGRSRLGRKHPSCLTLPSLVPALWLICMAIGFFAAMFSVTMAWVFAFSVLVYLTVLGVESLRLLISRRVGVAVQVPLVFLAIHVGFGWGFLVQSLHGMLNRETDPASGESELTPSF